MTERTGLVKREPSVLAPQSFTEAMAFAERVCTTDFVPESFKGNMGAVMAAMQYGAELGLGPMQSLNSLTVIHGKVGMYTSTMKALVESSGLMESCKVTFDAKAVSATAKVKRKGRPAVSFTFSKKDADRVPAKENHKTIKLSEKGMYRNYPQRMYPARALGFVLRDEFPDVLSGVMTVEEMRDAVPDRDERPVVVVEESPWAGIDADTQVVLSTAFDAVKFSTAQRTLKLREFDGDTERLLDWLRSEYAARQGIARTSKEQEKPEEKPAGPSETADVEPGETGTVTLTQDQIKWESSRDADATA